MEIEARSVLLVDDQSMFRVLLSEMLKELNFTYIEAAKNGEEALAALKFRTYSLIISDYNMGPINGLELLEAIKHDERHRSTPFVMISAKQEAEFAAKAIALGADAYLTRPIHFDALRAALEKL